MGFTSLEELLNRTEEEQIPFWKVIIEEELAETQLSEEETFERMRMMYQEMKKSEQSYDGSLKSASGLVGGDGEKMEQAVNRGNTLCGDLVGEVITGALKMGENNACMKRIVAAPTAGSCGVIPAVLLTAQRRLGLPEDKMIQALFVAAGIGQVIAARASISGAEGGCQAEIGSASAMTAGAAAYLMTQDGTCAVHASAMALKNLLGLTCDPVAGLVEVPCVKRNVIGAINALCAADMAAAGIKSAIPPDDVVDAMAEIGSMLPSCLKETSEGGLAVTKAGLKIAENLKSLQ